MSTETADLRTAPARAGGCPVTHAAASQGQIQASPLRRTLVLAYGLLAYAAFVVAFGYAIGFVGNWVVPKTIDSGAAGALWPSLAVNTALLGLFVVQHTIMARPWFKRWWTQYVPAPIERSTFVLLASGILLLLFWQWRPLPEIVWNVQAAWARAALVGLSLAGWAMVFISSFMVSHFDLFGLRQVWLHWRRQPYRHIAFKIVGIYHLCRHPLMVGFLIAFWATPTMTVGHLFFAIMTTVYILMGIQFEERDLIAHFGDDYRAYSRRVRGLLPIPRRS